MLRIAYDITILGINFSLFDSKTGIYRMTEDLMLALQKQTEVDLSFVSICGDSPAFSNFGCDRYCISNHMPEKYADSIHSRTGLRPIYKPIFDIYFSKSFQKKQKWSPQSIAIRGGIKLLSVSNFLAFDVDKKIDTRNYDILHSTYFHLPDKQLTKTLPRLLMIHDLIPIKGKEFVAKGLNHYFFKVLNSLDTETDWVICNSEYTRHEFCEYSGFPFEKTFVTALAADSRFTPSTDSTHTENVLKRYNVSKETYFLCLASQLEPRKNIPRLISAFTTFLQAHPDTKTKLLLVGTLRYKPKELDDAIKRASEFENRIVLTGYVPDEDLVALYNGAIAFVFPSLYEGFGMPILEAMQCGTPVISSNATSLPEVAGDAAILVDPTDEEALCQAMWSVLNDSELRQTLTQKGLARAKEFSWERCAEETAEIYRTIANQ